MRWRSISCLIVFAISACYCAAQPAFLLPNDVVPRKYTVDLTIDPSKPTFSGIARIEIELRRETDEIWLNGKDLIVGGADVDGVAARVEPVGGEFLAVRLDAPVGPGRFVILMRYQGKLDDKSVVGPYRKKVGNDWYVFTTFTPIDARRAFPCFDEPRFKAPWDLTIHTRRELKAFANGREESVIDEPNNMHAIHFAETKPLPSEVVAFAVGPFDVVDGAPAGHGTPIRIITTRGLVASAKAAAQATVDVLPRLEAYTAMPYPFGKLDHIALPEGAFGAVENPGLITYRQTALLAAPPVDTAEKKRAIRSIQAHEMAHQWFGDLVTQATWDDVWLSEGFATWFSAKVMDEELPASQKRLAAVATRERVMAMEATPRGDRPVRLAMKNREDTRGVYGRTVYDKGASILLMLEGWLGEDKMRDGLRAYLKDHAFGNATTADLASALKAASGIDPTPVMDSFLNLKGVPVIRAECKDGKVNVEPVGTFSLPACVRGEGVNQICGVIDKAHRSIDLKHDCPGWIYMNAGATGYYRTNFNPAQLAALMNALPRLNAAERMTLALDLRASGQTVDLSPLLKKLAGDPIPDVASAAREGIGPRGR
jgi:cytosol alanyl aminopeptidase